MMRIDIQRVIRSVQDGDPDALTVLLTHCVRSNTIGPLREISPALWVDFIHREEVCWKAGRDGRERPHLFPPKKMIGTDSVFGLRGIESRSLVSDDLIFLRWKDRGKDMELRFRIPPEFFDAFSRDLYELFFGLQADRLGPYKRIADDIVNETEKKMKDTPAYLGSGFLMALNTERQRQNKRAVSFTDFPEIALDNIIEAVWTSRRMTGLWPRTRVAQIMSQHFHVLERQQPLREMERLFFKHVLQHPIEGVSKFPYRAEVP